MNEREYSNASKNAKTKDNFQTILQDNKHEYINKDLKTNNNYQKQSISKAIWKQKIQTNQIMIKLNRWYQ